jgi:hypothetical protein
MKLYRVELGYVVYVMAEDEAGAVEEADSAVTGFGAEEVVTSDAKRITSLSEIIESDWASGIPYGEKNDRTCREIVEAGDFRRLVSEETCG